MRDYAEKIANEIMNTTDFIATVNEKQVPDGTARFGVTIKTADSNIAPSIYVEGLHEEGASIEEAAKKILKIYEEHKMPQTDVKWYNDYEQVKERLVIKLLPKTFKTDVFRSAKSYGFEDLILVPYATAELGNGETGRILVTADHIEKWGMTKRAVIDEAIKNTKNGGVKMMSLMAFMSGMEDCPLPEDSIMDEPMIISNKEMAFGASAILGKIKDFKAKNPQGFFVIPSSVHEMIVIPKGVIGIDADAITAMVQAVNSEVVIAEERLSDHVYTF